MQFEEDFDCNSFVELEQTHHVIEKFLNNGTLEEVGSFVDACFRGDSRRPFPFYYDASICHYEYLCCCNVLL